ncbi:hypothetical protein WB401_37250 [Streptomyces brasiliscabiei]|uniref:Integral membrane protein n=2 Tax=Streptomyces TaxID=1883 RepID=A0ABU8GRE5_9ACTN|nr:MULTISPECIES: hypothetical protein [Streptomyces]MBZ3907728.1 hypothetical protein [Streptomyces griseiscabiei]MDX2912585.1 hypothetical protein [Streptomyces griseiscabiei]
MADNQNPQGNYDPAGSTQMFRAFVDETPSGGRAGAPAPVAGSSGPRVGVIVGVIAALAVVAAVVWLALA